ncbi:hypothetical protein E2562_018552 [Oryza meyeriana var. granulata]|uniref:Wall-associated receptor kinase galacturonan-binding domain-containing protein n=1 Tax=Oryza meyeriana var. granulata TaxID=110450 RepID=A0A6G1F946_9ORYZ|nr:hypothetical protein E2562_018552 [Oryza meyeriana var. granulata]
MLPVRFIALCLLESAGGCLSVLLVCLAPVTPASAQQPPGCPDKCGNISVPYPFGIAPGCARDIGFELDCNHTYSPPRLFLSGSSRELVSLSLAEGEAEPVYQQLGSTTCRYVFLAEDKWINTTFRGRANFNRTDDFAVPVVADWAIWNVRNCSASKGNETD